MMMLMLIMMLMPMLMLMLMIRRTTCWCQGWYPKQTSGLRLRPKTLATDQWQSYYSIQMETVAKLGIEEEYLRRSRQRGKGGGERTEASSSSSTSISDILDIWAPWYLGILDISEPWYLSSLKPWFPHRKGSPSYAQASDCQHEDGDKFIYYERCQLPRIFLLVCIFILSPFMFFQGHQET